MFRLIAAALVSTFLLLGALSTEQSAVQRATAMPTGALTAITGSVGAGADGRSLPFAAESVPNGEVSGALGEADALTLATIGAAAPG